MLFPFVTNQGGSDTYIVISNTSADPFGSERQRGACRLHYFGRTAEGNPVPYPEMFSVIAPGEQLVFTLSWGGYPALIRGPPGFRGYIIAKCYFAGAYGHAVITDLSGSRDQAIYPAHVVTFIQSALEAAERVRPT